MPYRKVNTKTRRFLFKTSKILLLLGVLVMTCIVVAFCFAVTMYVESLYSGNNILIKIVLIITPFLIIAWVVALLFRKKILKDPAKSINAIERKLAKWIFNINNKYVTIVCRNVHVHNEKSDDILLKPYLTIEVGSEYAKFEGAFMEELKIIHSEFIYNQDGDFSNYFRFSFGSSDSYYEKKRVYTWSEQYPVSYLEINNLKLLTVIGFKDKDVDLHCEDFEIQYGCYPISPL